jgi:hypothetical protein
MSVQRALFAIFATSALSVGMALPSFARPALLEAEDASSRINVRSAPTLSAKTPHYGVVGDRVEVLRTAFDSDSYAWHYVRFRSSGAEGWVRVDFVRYADTDQNRYAMLGNGTATGAQAERINVRSAPSTQANSPHFGLSGDIVQILDSTEGRDGYTWQYVQFPSGAKGWVRGDLVQEEGGC